MVVKLRLQHIVKLVHADRDTKRGKRGDAAITHTAGNNCLKGFQVRVVIDGNTMPAHPPADPYPDGGDLVEARDSLLY